MSRMAQNAMIETESPRINEDIKADVLQEDEDERDDILLAINDKSEVDTQDPYDSFMRRHLQHYGYFTGRNASYRNNFEGLENWHRNYDLRLSGTHSLSVDEEQLKRMGHYKSHKNVPLDAGLGQFFAEGQPPDDLLSRTTQLVFHYQAGKKIPKLREPRNLYALTKEPGPQQATRWPSHMQVVCSPIHFIEYTPEIPDPFYIPTGKEPTPGVRGTPSGEIIYLNDPGRDIYFMRSRVAGCRLAMRDISLTPRETIDQGNFTLEFESRFESGNLLKAVKINDYDYELTLRPDLYTDKHTQWYFFRVRNMVPGKTYRLTIVNLMKPSSLYNNGMKPLFYSETDSKKSKIGWTRAGSDIRYYRNNMGSISGRTYYSLTWTIEFPHKDDTCYFAHCYPYTYTDLQEYLLKVANDPVRSRFCKQRVLCRTLAGNLVYILTVTSPSRNPEFARTKKAVVLTARVHPGETNASWMMKGFLDFLIGSSPDAKLLRDNFIFKIVPMLNPDGVIVGNYRCSLAGRDLNRNYKSVLKDSFPSVWHTKMMIKRLHVEREVVLYCDLHGHSRKNNIFIYGCENKSNPQRKLKERVFPLMLSKNANSKFSYESCKFKVQKSKEGTGRVVVWLMGIMNSYTMEATFGGTTLGSRKGTHFSARDLEEMGHNFCDTLLDYCDPDTSKSEACYQEIQDRLRKQILKRMQMRNVPGSLGDVDIDDYSSDYESDTSGSDSSCDDGLPVHLLAIAPKLQRKRRLKTRRDRNKQSLRKSSSAPGQDDAKPTPSHGAKQVLEKHPKTVRYSQTAGNRRREEHNPTVSVGTTPQATAFHTEDNMRTPKKSDYLEALTTAYIRSGVLMVPDKKNAVSDYSMRYTNGNGKNKESNSTVQYLTSQLADLTAESDSENDTGPLMRNAACQWSPQPESFTNLDSDSKSYDDATKEAVLAEEQYEILRRSALRRQLSPAQQRILAQRHLVAVAQMQQRREQATTNHRPALSSEIRRGGGTPLKQHPNPFEADDTGQSRSNSRCTSATWKQDIVRKIQGVQSSSRPGSHETGIRSSPEKTITTSNHSTVPSTDSTLPIKKNTALPSSTDTTIEDKKLIAKRQAEQTLDSIINATIKQKPPSSPIEPSRTSSSNFSAKSASMHSPTEEVENTDSQGISSSVQPNKIRRQKESTSKAETILPLDIRDNNYSSITTPSNDTIAPQEFSSTMPNSVIEESVVKGTTPTTEKSSINGSLHSPGHVIKTNSVFGESLDPLPEKPSDDKASAREVVISPRPRVRIKPSSQASMLTNGNLGQNEISLEKIPKQWGGQKQLVLLDVKEESSPELIKRDRPRALSAKKNPLSSVIAEGHTNRVRVKTYQGNGENETYFGMSDKVGPTGMKHGERVPPVVANIAELRRTLMGQGRDTKDEEPNIKGIPPPNLAKPKNHQTADEEKVSKRRSINLRPRANTRLSESIFEEADPMITNGVEDSKQAFGPVPEENRCSTSRDSTRICNGATAGHETNEFRRRHEKNSRRHTPPALRHTEHSINQMLRNSDEIEELLEEKWPSPSEIRRYSQGNATIEKLSDNSLTNIRFGSKTNEQTKRLREQWIDVHQRQVVSSVSNRQDMLAMSSVSLNIEREVDEKICATTPALAKRPVPPLLRYLSAKQTTKRKW